MLNLDLLLLETWQRFERFCCHLAREDFPNAVNTRGSWDGGRDVMVWSALGWNGDIVWQCKFIHDFGPTNRRAILESIKLAVAHYDESARLLTERIAEDKPYGELLAKMAAARGEPPGPPQMKKWILCVPIKVTASFLDWLRMELAPYPFEWRCGTRVCCSNVWNVARTSSIATSIQSSPTSTVTSSATS